MIRNRSLILILGAVLALVVLTGHIGRAAAHPATDYCADAEEQAFLVLINDYRKDHGLAPLVASQALGAAAEHHSLDMAANDFLGHTGSDASDPKQRMTAHGYGFDTWWAENVFAGDETAAGALTWWKNSPGHNANMLSPNYVAIGIARAYDANSTYGWYWTTTFGGVADGAACVEPPGGAQPPVNDDDPDGDGLTDMSEIVVHGTDPNNPDTDGDGSSDGEEIYYGTNPGYADVDTDSDSSDDDSDDSDSYGSGDYGRGDVDGDGLYDDDETDVYSTDPGDPDTDGDGAGDGEEVYYGTDPLNAYDV
jgi:uncharacterized protein YkwD